MIKRIINYFDKLEDRNRHRLSRHPVLYAMICAVGIVLLWRGIWDLADLTPGLNPLVTIAISLTILLLTGTFVSFFIGEHIILSGIRSEKRIDEKTEVEIQKEEIELYHLDKDLESVKKQLAEIKQIIERAHFK